jgi:MFS family permease
MAGVGAAGFAPSIYILIVARALQGVGFAIIPLGLAIITDAFPREKVAQAQGIISGTFAIGAAAGLVVGSYVVQDLGWQYAFHTALILSLILFAIVAKVLQKDILAVVKKRIDFAGAGILMAGITLVLLFVTEGPSLGWLSVEEVAFLVPGVALTALFFVVENRIQNPLMQLALLKIRNVLVANLVGITTGAVMFLVFFASTYYSQLPLGFGLGLNVTNAGLTLAPSTLGMLIGGLVIGRFLPRLGPKPVLLSGSAIMTVGMLLFITDRATSTLLALDMFVTLLGLVAVLVPITNMLAIALPRESIAVGLGMNTMLRNLGGAVGPVVATTIMTSYTSTLFPGVSLPNSTAFTIIFYVGIALTLLIVGISLATKNYTFSKALTKPQ